MPLHHSTLKDIEDLVNGLDDNKRALARGKLQGSTVAYCIEDMLLKAQDLIEVLQRAKRSMSEQREG